MLFARFFPPADTQHQSVYNTQYTYIVCIIYMATMCAGGIYYDDYFSVARHMRMCPRDTCTRTLWPRNRARLSKCAYIYLRASLYLFTSAFSKLFATRRRKNYAKSIKSILIDGTRAGVVSKRRIFGTIFAATTRAVSASCNFRGNFPFCSTRGVEQIFIDIYGKMGWLCDNYFFRVITLKKTRNTFFYSFQWNCSWNEICDSSGIFQLLSFLIKSIT